MPPKNRGSIIDSDSHTVITTLSVSKYSLNAKFGLRGIKITVVPSGYL